VFWACTTDAVGFASLMVARVGPVQDFGLMMAAGCLMVLVSVVLLGPGLSLAGRHPSHTVRLGERLLATGLTGSLHRIERRPKVIGAAAAIICIATAAGAYRLEVETDFTKNFRAHSPIVRAYKTVETKLGGAGVWDVIVPAPETLNHAYVEQVRELERRLRHEVTMTDEDGTERPALKTLSLADVTCGPLGDLPLPAAIDSMRSSMPVFTAALHGKDPESPENYYYRIMLRANERQPTEQKSRLIDEVTRISREEFQGAEVTGFFVLLTNLIGSVIRDQWLAFGVALTGIGLTMLLAFGRPLYALIALVPNALPILMVTGLMGWIGLRINMGAAMIAAVSVGLSVDSSIHYISFFRRARAAGKTVTDALAEVQQSVGRAMVFSTLALVVGFAVLTISEFVPTIYFGSLVALSMLGGLVGNLVILPLLLRLVTREQAIE
jgi:predicted RND superfamily exporter protein